MKASTAHDSSEIADSIPSFDAIDRIVVIGDDVLTTDDGKALLRYSWVDEAAS